MILFCICTPIYICSWYFTYILLHFLIRKKIAPISIILNTYSMIQYKTNVNEQLIVFLLDKVYEIMKPSECPFFHIRFIVLYKHATCSPQFFVKTYQKSLRHRNFISLCDVKYWHIEYPNLSLKRYSTKPYFIQQWMQQRRWQRLLQNLFKIIVENNDFNNESNQQR